MSPGESGKGLSRENIQSKGRYQCAQQLVVFLQGEAIQRRNKGIILWTPASKGPFRMMESTQDEENVERTDKNR